MNLSGSLLNHISNNQRNVNNKTSMRVGLLIFNPNTVSFANGNASLTFPPTWLEVPVDLTAFTNFITEVSDLLEGPIPQENSNCQWCKYRHLGEQLSHPQTADIPF